MCVYVRSLLLTAVLRSLSEAHLGDWASDILDAGAQCIQTQAMSVDTQDLASRSMGEVNNMEGTIQEVALLHPRLSLGQARRLTSIRIPIAQHPRGACSFLLQLLHLFTASVASEVACH